MLSFLSSLQESVWETAFKLFHCKHVTCALLQQGEGYKVKTKKEIRNVEKKPTSDSDVSPGGKYTYVSS